jgi:hypothetical protein
MDWGDLIASLIIMYLGIGAILVWVKILTRTLVLPPPELDALFHKSLKNPWPILWVIFTWPIPLIRAFKHRET